MELSPEMFERIVGLLADNRVALTSLQGQIVGDVEKIHTSLGDIRKDLMVLKASVDGLEEDVHRVAPRIPVIESLLAEHTQALDGITQLSKTVFDSVESLNRHVLGESGKRDHGDREIQKGIPQ